MKHNAYLVPAALLLYISTALYADAPVAPFLQWRSQGRDTGRKLVGTTSHHVYLDDMESFYGTLNMTMQYDRSFRPHAIDSALFGSSLYDIPNASDAASPCNNGGRSLIISGLSVPNRNNTKDWMAENFLLPTDFESSITFSPLVQDFLVDFNLYVGLDEWVKGLYFRIYGPVVNNRTNLRAKETIIQPGSTAGSYPQGYFSSQGQVTPDQLFSSALQFFNGNSLIAPIDNITYIPLAFAKITPCGTHSKTGFAELRGEFGWNYLHEDYHFGLNIQSAAPTGKRPQGEYLLEPQIGNGKHWELGIGLSGHWTMWRSEDEEKHFDLVLEADVTHLFNAKQTRTFDLIGKSNSRYMLAEKLTTNKGTTNSLSGASNANLEFANVYSPVANFSTRSVNVSIGVQGDAIAMLNYTSRGFSWDLGYNIWGMSREKITLSNCNNPFPENIWALKGDASIAGTATVAGAAVTVLLAATEDSANIHTGTNVLTTGNPLTNPGVDNRVLATTEDNLMMNVPVNAFSVVPTTQIYSSNPPIFIEEADLDLHAAEIAGYSNKIFTHLSYTWIDREDWIPYFGIGFNAEFGNSNTHDGNDNNPVVAESNGCDGGIRFALSKWAVLMKGGVSFD